MRNAEIRATAFACLTVGDDGIGRGGFHGGASFMRLRNQRDDTFLWRVFSADSAAYYDEDREDVQVTTTHMYHPEPFTAFEAAFVFGALLPGWVTGSGRDSDGPILTMSHFASESWATVCPSEGGEGEHKVYHQGPRRLWVELDAAHRWWTSAGCPDHTRFGLTVAPVGQALWLDTPDRVVPRQW